MNLSDDDDTDEELENYLQTSQGKTQSTSRSPSISPGDYSPSYIYKTDSDDCTEEGQKIHIDFAFLVDGKRKKRDELQRQIDKLSREKEKIEAEENSESRRFQQTRIRNHMEKGNFPKRYTQSSDDDREYRITD